MGGVSQWNAERPRGVVGRFQLIRLGWGYADIPFCTSVRLQFLALIAVCGTWVGITAWVWVEPYMTSTQLHNSYSDHMAFFYYGRSKNWC